MGNICLGLWLRNKIYSDTIDKTKVLKTSGSLVQVKSIAECLVGNSAILLTCI